MTAYPTRPLLYAEVVEQIKEKIESGLWTFGDRIPSESELAETFRVSRATLREGISYLVNKGILVRRRGIGTFVGHKEEITGGLETLVSTTQWILSHGYEPGTQDVHFISRPPSQMEKELFQTAVGGTLGEIHRVRTADGVPIMYCVDIMPTSYMPDGFNPLGESLMAYLETRLGQVITVAHSHIEVVMATRDIADRLGLTQGTPLLKLKQVHYNASMTPVFLSQDHFVPERFKFDIVRRRP